MTVTILNDGTNNFNYMYNIIMGVILGLYTLKTIIKISRLSMQKSDYLRVCSLN